MLFGGAQVSRAMSEKSRRGEGLRKNDANRDEDSAGTRCVGHGDFQACALWILIAAAKADSTF